MRQMVGELLVAPAPVQTKRQCPHCGGCFFTSGGLSEHIAACLERQAAAARADKIREGWVAYQGRLTPAQLAAQRATQQECGRRVAAHNNARRRRCLTCGKVSTPAGVGSHQRYTGHTGWEAV